MFNKLIAIAAILLLANTLAAQDANTTLPASFFTSGPAIEEGVFRAKYEETAAQIEVQRREIADLRAVIKTLESQRCPCCESGECQCKAQRAQQPVSPWKIVMESIPRCDGCEWADKHQRPKYLGLGWQWETIHLPGPQPGVRMYPRYLICNGQTCEVIEIDKYVDELDAKLTALLARRNEIPAHDKRGRFLGNW